MSPRPSTLLGLVLCLGQTIHMQEGALPKMTLRDKPGPVVPRRQPVTVCLGPAVANICRLEKDGRTVSRYQNPVPLDDSQGTEDRFLFPAVTEETAGNYRCFCFTRFGRFELREPLELKVAGALPKPSLRAEPGPVIPRGRPVTFVCWGPAWAEIFYLEKDGSHQLPRTIERTQLCCEGRGYGTTFPSHSVCVLCPKWTHKCLSSSRGNCSHKPGPLCPVPIQPSRALPKPSIRAEPGPVIPWGWPVTFVCQGPAGVHSFYLEKDGRPVYPYEKRASQGGMKGTEARFLFPVVSEVTAGSYRCLYEQAPNSWSERSEALELQVTEEDVFRPLPKPSLRAEPGPVVPRGRPVTFVCNSPVWAQSFRLEKDGRPVYADEIRVSPGGEKEARFLIPAVSEVTAGRYRCFYKRGYEWWSERSEPLELQVTEDVSTPPSGPASRDYTVENSIRMGLAGVVLLILVAILVEAGLSQRRAPQGPQE
uniref:Immunoglobulin domain-containing protein n=1 Tax=Myotis lucifugus TaxID=59463 RepID=G1Q6Y6_MYOLU